MPAKKARAQKDDRFFEAVGHIRAADKKLALLMDRVGPCRLSIEEMHSPFDSLSEAIVYQQLSGKAAATIMGRVKSIFGSSQSLAPAKILATSDETLRAAGLSAAKLAALKDLSAKAHSGFLPSLAEMEGMEDEEIVERLTTIRGVGRWTVEMMLIFRLGRLDVLPATDYGIRKGFALTYRKRDLPTPKQIHSHAERWRPYRTVASWYLWRALELK